MQSNDNNINCQDPLERLPQELLTHSLLFLPPTSRCVSNAISKDWRKTVLFIPLLHQEIDFSKMGRAVKDINPRDPLFALGPIIFKYALLKFLPVEDLRNMVAVCMAWREFVHLHYQLGRAFSRYPRRYADKKRINRILLQLDRLSSLALNKVVKISVNLSSFFDDWRFWDSDEIEWETIGLGRLLTALLSCEGTLREVQIKVDPFNPPEDMGHDTVQMTSYLLEDLLVFERLEHVQIDAPSLISLEAGEDIPGSKYFCLNNNDSNRDLESETRFFVPIINHVKAFLGTEDLNRFFSFVVENRTFNHEFLLSEELAILREVENFTATLHTLGLRFSSMDALELWESVMKCTNLTSLSLGLPHDENLDPEDGPISLPVPLDKSLHLKRLVLDASDASENCLQADWAALASWAGEELEEIEVSALQIQSIPGQPSGSFFSILMNSKSTLRTIKLRFLSEYEEKAVDFDVVNLFPNLKHLHLDYLCSFILKFFSCAHCPNLEDLSMWVFGRQPQESYQAFLGCFLSLCNSSSSSLVKILLGRGFPDNTILPPPPPFGASFPRLETLDIYSCRERLFSYFSSFKCPCLVSIDDLDDAIFKRFRRNTPKLCFSETSTEMSRYHRDF